MSEQGSDDFESGSFAGTEFTSLTSKGKRSRVQDDLGGSVDQGRYQRARNTVNKAMRENPQIAYRLEYIVEHGSVSSKRSKVVSKDPDMEVLPSCSNTYTLIGKIRIMKLLMLFRPLEKDPTSTWNQRCIEFMKLDDLKLLICYALCCTSQCHVPSKVWGQLRNAAVERYKSIGNNRLDNTRT